MTFPKFAGEGLGRGREEREEGGRNGKKAGGAGRGREEREEGGRSGKMAGRSGRGTRESVRADWRRRLLEGGEKGGGL